MDIFTAASSKSTVSPETLRSDLPSLLATEQHGAQNEHMVGTLEAGPYSMGPELLARSQFAQLTLDYYCTDDQPVKLSKPTASPVTKKTKLLYNVHFFTEYQQLSTNSEHTSRLPYDIPTISPPTARKRRTRNSFEGQLQECRERDTIYDKNRHFIDHAIPNARNRKQVHHLLYQDDCARNPYLQCSRQELMIALTQCKIQLPEQGEGSRFKCRAALEKAIKASQSAKSLLLDLPKEIKTMVYELALWQDTNEPIDVVKDSRTWPALSGVSRQVRQESIEVFLRKNCFRLHTEPENGHPILASSMRPEIKDWDSKLDYGTSKWLQKIGPKRIAKLRRLSFTYGRYREVEVDLRYLDASRWTMRELPPWVVTNTPENLEEDLKFWQTKKQEYVDLHMFYAYQQLIETTEGHIVAAQIAMNAFVELCGIGNGDFGIVTQLYPGRHSTQRLARALREDDCSNNPYLKWSRLDILPALQNRQIAISEADSESRWKRRLALELADKTATFHFLELPKEVRMLVYEQALLHQGVFKPDSHTPPALLQINQQVRQESREIFFSINCFRLRTRRCIIRRFDKTAKTQQTVRLHPYDLEWLQMIGSENVVRLRRLSFITRLGINGGKGIQLDLSLPDVSRWAQPLKCGCRECQTKAPWTVGQQIEKSDKEKKWLDSCCSNPEILILYTKALEEEIRTRDSAQMAMNGFGERYGKGKSVKPTIEGLELLGGCIMQNFGRKEWIWSHCRD
ncbi:hypothetical protein JADG_004456 [Aureobasidium aubasidani]|nr:hypothetical protein JADG_004456 [Aureobasidium pullulans]